MDFASVTQRLIAGFGQTCLIFALTLLFALPIGFLVAFCSMSKFKPLKILTRGFVWVIRGTPLMLQVIIVFYGPGLLFNMESMGRIEAVIVAFIINYAAYFSEIYRGGIESVPKGQYEAGAVLGMTKRQVFFSIILLQVIKRVLAPMGNEVITLVKDTSLARIIAVKEIIMTAQECVTTYALIWPLFYSGAFYLLFCCVLTLLFGYGEKKLAYFVV